MASKKGRVAKTLVVPVRLDPVLKWAAELAAGKERRSVNSFVEWAIERAVKDVTEGRDYQGHDVSAWDIAHRCWHIIPGFRIKQLAVQCPDALTVKEREIVQAVALLSPQYDDNDEWLYRNPKAWEQLSRFGEGEISFDALQRNIYMMFSHVGSNERRHIFSDFDDFENLARDMNAPEESP